MIFRRPSPNERGMWTVKGFVPQISVTGHVLFSSFSPLPSLMLCLSTDNLSIGAFVLRNLKCHASAEVPARSWRANCSRAARGGARLIAEVWKSEPPDLPASSLSSKPHHYCKGLGWELEAEELFKNKTASLVPPIAASIGSYCFSWQTAQWLAR